MVKIFSCLLMICFLFKLQAESPDIKLQQHVAPKKLLTSRQQSLLKYFSISSASSYGFLYLIAYSSGEPIVHSRLLGYSIGIPAVLGLGMYLGILARLKPFTSLTT